MEFQVVMEILSCKYVKQLSNMLKNSFHNLSACPKKKKAAFTRGFSKTLKKLTSSNKLKIILIIYLNQNHH